MSALKFNYCLFPLSLFYGLGVWLRNQLFNRRILTVEHFPVPVICVGNLAVGGTGKTPHVEYLIRLLRRRYRIAVLSRGYARKTKGFLLAGPGSTSHDIGDEPAQMIRKFPDILLAVDSNRRRGIRNLLALSPGRRPEVILMDDGIQHRYVQPSLSIILTDYHRLYYRDKLLPAGRLREPAGEIGKAGIVIVTRCDKSLKPIDFRIMESDMGLFRQELFFTGVQYGELAPLFPAVAPPRTLQEIKKEDDVLLFPAIASPAPFVEEISKYSARVVTIEYPDHYSLDKQDIHRLMTVFANMSSPGKLMIVTEKDAARLTDNPCLPEEWKEKLYVLPVTVLFHREKGSLFDDLIIRHIGTFRPANT
jgi:tetraacyldisaccharide 4'-kinase